MVVYIPLLDSDNCICLYVCEFLTVRHLCCLNLNCLLFFYLLFKFPGVRLFAYRHGFCLMSICRFSYFFGLRSETITKVKISLCRHSSLTTFYFGITCLCLGLHSKAKIQLNLMSIAILTTPLFIHCICNHHLGFTCILIDHCIRSFWKKCLIFSINYISTYLNLLTASHIFNNNWFHRDFKWYLIKAAAFLWKWSNSRNGKLKKTVWICCAVFTVVRIMFTMYCRISPWCLRHHLIILQNLRWETCIFSVISTNAPNFQKPIIIWCTLKPVWILYLGAIRRRAFARILEVHVWGISQIQGRLTLI